MQSIKWPTLAKGRLYMLLHNVMCLYNDAPVLPYEVYKSERGCFSQCEKTKRVSAKLARFYEWSERGLTSKQRSADLWRPCILKVRGSRI